MLGVVDVLLGFTPAALWLIHIARKDDWEREPWRVVLGVFALGALAAFAIVHSRPRIEGWFPALDGDAGLALDAFLVTALPEELAKLAAVALGALWLSEWDEPLDGLVYGAAAGLGFAAVENAVFFATSNGEPSVFGRAFTSTLAHACFTGSAAFLLGLARLSGWRRSGWFLGAAVVVAVVPHGLYDLLLLGDERRAPWALIGVLPAALALFALQVRWARARSIHYHPVRGPAPLV